MKTKIIKIDNYNREHISDVLYKENVTRIEGGKLVMVLNQHYPNGPDFYRLVEDDYKLYEWEP